MIDRKRALKNVGRYYTAQRLVANREVQINSEPRHKGVSLCVGLCLKRARTCIAPVGGGAVFPVFRATFAIRCSRCNKPQSVSGR